MATFLENNWILTTTEEVGRTSWAVVRNGVVIHSDELAGDDPSAFRAYRAGIVWAEEHCPGVSFHWRHQSHVERMQRETSLSRHDGGNAQKKK
jgi:hypothetical protein